jgi:hypothetical protein
MVGGAEAAELDGEPLPLRLDNGLWRRGVKLGLLREHGTVGLVGRALGALWGGVGVEEGEG